MVSEKPVADTRRKAALTVKHLFQMIHSKKKYAVNEVLDVSVIERQAIRRV